MFENNAKQALDDLATPLKDQRGYIVEVQGFSSGHGTTPSATSQKMADAVVRYLVLNHDIPVYRIYVVGMGNAPVQNADPETRRPRLSGGRVEVSLLKNDLEQLASSSNTTTTCSTPPTESLKTTGQARRLPQGLSSKVRGFSICGADTVVREKPDLRARGIPFVNLSAVSGECLCL